MEFKDKVLYIRAKLNISQTELANKLNVSFSTINRWETGKAMPTRKAILAFDLFCKDNEIVIDESEN